MSPVMQERTLDDLATDIRREIEAAESDYRSAIEHAIEAGKLLIEAKDHVGHGGWMKWLQEHFPGDHTTANDYMRLAKDPEQIGGAPSIRAALKLLARPRKEAKPVRENGSGALASAEPVNDVCAGLDDDQLDGLLDAAEPLWNVLADLGWTDAYGSDEFHRLYPAVLAFIRREANAVPSSPNGDR